MQYEPPFHEYTPKKVGDRVRVSKFATDESKGFYYGTVIQLGSASDDRHRIPKCRVQWDEPCPIIGDLFMFYSVPLLVP